MGIDAQFHGTLRGSEKMDLTHWGPLGYILSGTAAMISALVGLKVWQFFKPRQTLIRERDAALVDARSRSREADAERRVAAANERYATAIEKDFGARLRRVESMIPRFKRWIQAASKFMAEQSEHIIELTKRAHRHGVDISDLKAPVPPPELKERFTDDD